MQFSARITRIACGHSARIQFDEPRTGGKSFFWGALNVITFGSAQCQCHPTSLGGFPDPDGPPVKAAEDRGAKRE